VLAYRRKQTSGLNRQLERIFGVRVLEHSRLPTEAGSRSFWPSTIRQRQRRRGKMENSKTTTTAAATRIYTVTTTRCKYTWPAQPINPQRSPTDKSHLISTVSATVVACPCLLIRLIRPTYDSSSQQLLYRGLKRLPSSSRRRRSHLNLCALKKT
jgi:hypothetical protein